MAKGLTEKQRRILEHIIDFQKANGFPPTIRELGDAFGIGSLRGVTVHLDALVRKGFMTRERTSRSIRITGPDPRDMPVAAASENLLQLPLLLTLSKEAKSLTDGHIERMISIPSEFVGAVGEDGFVFRVGASGVYGEPILPGDLVVCRPQASVSAGELVVIWSQGDLVICRADGSDYDVVGRVIGVLRRY